MMMREKIIVMEDHASLRLALERFLSGHGYEVKGFPVRGMNPEQLIRQYEPDLLLLDLPHPVSDIIRICTGIRKFSDKPILLMSDKEEGDLIACLAAGGDDYIWKPVHFDLLLAQIKALIRRYKGTFPANQRDLLQFPDLKVNLANQSVVSHGREAVLSSKEFQLLVMLAKNPNRVFQTEVLYDLIWNRSGFGDLRTVMVHIYNLRKKIEINPRNPRYIHTVRGSGYKFYVRAL